MEQLVSGIIQNIPNLAVAVWMLWQQNQTITSLLGTQEKLVDRLLAYVENDRREVAALLADGGRRPE